MAATRSILELMTSTLGSDTMKYCFSKVGLKLSSKTKSFSVKYVNTILTLRLRTMYICMVKVSIPGPEIQSQNRADVCYGKSFGLGA